MKLTLMQGQKLAWFLYQLAGSCADAPYYLGGDGSYEVRATYVTLNIDVGATFCRECAEGVARMLEAHGFPKERDGDWLPVCQHDGETDTGLQCAWCCRLLDYSFTNEGAAQEAAHYVEHPPSWPLAEEDAFHLASIYESGYGADTALNACVKRCLANGGHELESVVGPGA